MRVETKKIHQPKTIFCRPRISARLHRTAVIAETTPDTRRKFRRSIAHRSVAHRQVERPKEHQG